MIKSDPKFISEIASKLRALDFHKNDFQNINNFPLNSKQCLYIIDWQDGKVSYQKDIDKLLGYREDEFNLETVLSIAHPEDLNLIKKLHRPR
jgi:predicted transcriptional regulator